MTNGSVYHILYLEVNESEVGPLVPHECVAMLCVVQSGCLTRSLRSIFLG